MLSRSPRETWFWVVGDFLRPHLHRNFFPLCLVMLTPDAHSTPRTHILSPQAWNSSRLSFPSSSFPSFPLSFSPSLLPSFFSLLETGFLCGKALALLGLSLQSRIASNSQRCPCLYLSSVWIKEQCGFVCLFYTSQCPCVHSHSTLRMWCGWGVESGCGISRVHLLIPLSSPSLSWKHFLSSDRGCPHLFLMSQPLWLWSLPFRFKRTIEKERRLDSHLQLYVPRLSQPNQPCSDLSWFESLDAFCGFWSQGDP